MQHAKHKRGFVDPLIFVVALLPVYLADLGIDAFHAVRAEEVDEFDYEAEVARIALAKFNEDETRIAAAEQAWHDLNEATDLHAKLLKSFDDPEKDEGWYLTGHGYGVITYPDDIFTEIEEHYRNATKESKNQAIKDVERQREMAVEAVQSFEKLGITKLMQRVAEADASYMELLDAEGNLTASVLASDHRTLCRGLNAAKVYARQRGDWDGYVEYHRLSLALSRHWMQQADTLAWLTGVAMRSVSKGDLRNQLARGVIPAPVIRELRRAEREQAHSEHVFHLIAEQHAEALEWIDLFYREGGVAYIDDPGHLINLVALLIPRRDVAERIANRYFEELGQYATLDIATRRQEKDSFADSLFARRSFMSVVLYAHVYTAIDDVSLGPRLLQSSEKVAIEQFAIDLLIAMELYKADEKGLPGSLRELVPDYLSEVPTDPYDPEGGLLRYRLLEEPDELGRNYVLYSVGSDGEDNGGHLGVDGWPGHALLKRHAGTDYIINFHD